MSAIVADPVSPARQGYAVVVQDVRGRFGSAGEFDVFHREQANGFDAVEWAAAQPWCDGRVGIYGSSYHVMTTCQAIVARPPHLRAAVAMIGATDLRATTHPGGLFELSRPADLPFRPPRPVPTCGGASCGAALGPDGVQDRRAVEARDDVLLWTSGPLEEPLCVAGP